MPSAARPDLQPRGSMAITAGVALVAASAVAWADDVPSWELDLTTAINNVPDAVAALLYPIMQLGTVVAPVAAGALIGVFASRVRLGALTAAAGLITWFGAKLIKRIVDRDRPLAYLPELDVREGDGAGLGYLSGHSAVAACMAVMASAVVPPRWRPALAVTAGLVGVARIAHGAHLPADVVGGWSFGTLVALGSLMLVDRWERPASSDGSTA